MFDLTNEILSKHLCMQLHNYILEFSYLLTIIPVIIITIWQMLILINHKRNKAAIKHLWCFMFEMLPVQPLGQLHHPQNYTSIMLLWPSQSKPCMSTNNTLQCTLTLINKQLFLDKCYHIVQCDWNTGCKGKPEQATTAETFSKNVYREYESYASWVVVFSIYISHFTSK